MSQSQNELCTLTIREAGLLIASGQISPVELTKAFLERIEEVDDRLHSYVTVLPDEALAEARVAEAEVLQGLYRGPMHGIPIALKDLYDTKGVRTTGQSKVHEHRVPTEDSTATARLREGGSVLLGKLAMHEFALGGPRTSLFEQARNPWNLDHVTGGSSSGSGAAVAAATCMGSLGSDTGGSIRGPASLCGIVGLKPTYGRVSRCGVIPLSWSLDHCGPMTWTVEDAALMLQVIAGHDPKDPSSSHAPVPDYLGHLRGDVRGMVIGMPRHYFFDTEAGLDAETLEAVDKALADLESLGGRLEEVEIPSLAYAGISNTVIMIGEAFAYHRDNMVSQPENFGETVRTRFYQGSLFTSHDYIQAQRARNRLKREYAEALQKVDVIASPMSVTPASRIDEVDPLAALGRPSYSAPYNQTGLPAISVPCGFTDGGLPIGLQIAGKPFDETTVMNVAYAHQQHAGWFERRPQL